MEAVFILIGAVVVMFGIVIWTFISYHNNLKNGKGLIDEVVPVEINKAYATILDKHIIMEKSGSSKMPDHRISYLVRFRLDNGTETAISVPQKIFDDLPVGARDILITQDKDFIDFGNRYGEDLTENSDQ
jgi:Protein of unknown function (DUF2500).